MARIYYDEKKLGGEPFQSATLNIENFRYIFENTDIPKNYPRKVNVGASVDSLFGRLLNYRKDFFKTALLYTDDIEYDSSTRSVYIPNSIIFYDNEDYHFPSEFYFIARIEDQIEIRKCNGGNNVKWSNIPDLHEAIYDSKIIHKIENTFLVLLKLVETTFKIEKERILKEEKKAPKPRPFLSDTEKEGYQQLTELCVFNTVNKVKILDFIDTLKNYDNDDVYFTTLNYFLDFLYENEFPFIIQMDWKAEIETLEWLINSAIKANHDLKNALPVSNHLAKYGTVSENGVFRDCNKLLSTYGLHLSFIDTESDEYIAVLHKKQDKEKIVKAIELIDYAYYEM